jgi:SAM-dependent methyltransferase
MTGEAGSHDNGGDHAHGEPWYVRAFRREYLDVYAHRNEADAGRAVDFCISQFGGGLDGPLLDLCCGAGRHLRLFEEAGLECVGVDLSGDLLERARTDGVRSPLVLADARSLPLPDESFSGLVNLFSSFGYFEEEPDHERMLREARRVLRPGARAVFDLMNPGWVQATLKPESEEQRNGLAVHSRRRISVHGPRVEKHVQIFRGDSGELVSEYTESVRLFDAGEFDALLMRAGLGPVARFGDFGRDDYDPRRSPRQIVVARTE